MTDSLTYSGRFTKDNDPDRFFLSLLSKNPQDLWPLLAFNGEISKTREVVTDTTIGLIRLQWWRDALDKFYDDGTIIQHEIVKDLTRVIKTYDLPKEDFESLLYAREFDLEDILPASLEGLTNYADYTHTPLLKLMTRVMGQQEEVRSLAVAYTLTGLMRSVLYHARQHRCYLPQDVLTDHAVNMAQFYNLKPQPELNSVIVTIASLAKRYLNEVNAQTAYTRGMKHLTLLYLKRMSKCEFDPFNKNWIAQPPFKEIRVAFVAKMFRP